MTTPRPSRVQHDSPRKNRLIGACIMGIPVAAAAEEENIPRSTAYNIWNKYLETGTTHYEPRSGRPPKMSEHGKRYAVREVTKSSDCRRQPLREVGNRLEPPVCERTLMRFLDDCQLHRCIARAAPYITAINQKKRKAWAATFKEFTMEDWHRVIWSDECYVFLSNEHQRIYVTCRPGEEYHPDCLVPRFQQSNI